MKVGITLPQAGQQATREKIIQAVRKAEEEDKKLFDSIVTPIDFWTTQMLEEYNKKRNFVRTPEPRGDTKQPRDNKSKFVVQKHDATRLHYDFRLEDKKERVLKSWAVPKGISLDPKVKRLAILTEDHPLDYLLFEGVIPEGSYGAGTVIVWDTGTFASEEDISDQFKKGKITFSLYGQKLRGKFKLIRIRSRRRRKSVAFDEIS